MDILKQKLNELGSLRLRAIEPGLERTRALMERLKHPERKLDNIIHVAGTNGKGSTLAFLRAILEAAGYTCNVYTSPDLIRFNERIVLSGKEISDEYLLELIDRYHAETAGIDATFFEATTAVAFMAFAENPADYTLIETGLGGRLDSTNVAENPILTIITPISFDHMDFLGNTIESIASEKAGIIKPKVPCVISRQKDEALKVITAKCAEAHAEPISLGKQWDYQIAENGFLLTYKNSAYSFPQPSLPGTHQYLNAACASAAALTLGINTDSIAAGIVSARWPARLQRITKGEIPGKLGDSWEIWLDGAHNEDGAKTLAEFISGLPQKPTYIISAMLKTKAPFTFFKYLKPVSNKILTIPIPNELSTHAPETLSEICLEAGINSSAHGDINSALKELSGYNITEARLVICGSLYLAGAILKGNA